MNIQSSFLLNIKSNMQCKTLKTIQTNGNHKEANRNRQSGEGVGENVKWVKPPSPPQLFFTV